MNRKEPPPPCPAPCAHASFMKKSIIDPVLVEIRAALYHNNLGSPYGTGIIGVWVKTPWVFTQTP